MAEIETNLGPPIAEFRERWKKLKQEARKKNTTDERLLEIRQHLDNLLNGGSALQ